MAGKTLSNGTLSLRFMQNAHRAKLQAQVEAEQAKIKDEAEWSVSQEVRDAWGIGTSSEGDDSEVRHESSYIPFIFHSVAGEGSSFDPQADEMPKLRGRRTFNARGHEVIADEWKSVAPSEEAGREPEGDSKERERVRGQDVSDEKPRSRFEKRPTSISGFRAPVSTKKDGKKARTKTAQMLIREDQPARPPESFNLQPSHDSTSESRPVGFIKPEGVDAPVPHPRKRDREHSSGTEHTNSAGKKKKRKEET